MRKCETDRLLAELNTLNGKTRHDIGYYFFADIRGDGSNRRSVYVIINSDGGVSYSHLNADSARGRCRRIRREIERVRLQRARAAEADRIASNRHPLGRAPAV